jgi:nucleoside-diphosphate-sugar epimerase
MISSKGSGGSWRRLLRTDEHREPGRGEDSPTRRARIVAGWERVGNRLRRTPRDDPEVRCPDIFLARELLAWEPNVPLTEGLTKTVEWAGAAWTEV